MKDKNGKSGEGDKDAGRSGLISRRGFIGASAAGSAAVGLALTGAGPAAADTPAAATTAGTSDTTTTAFCVTPPNAVTVTASDPRYGYLTTRGKNVRFTSTASDVHQVFTTGQVVAAVESAVAAGQRIAVRGGGHCLDDLVDNPSVQTVIDMSRMNAVYYDSTHQAFAVEAGALLQDVYETLLLGWGVTVPGGTCPTVGVGGYVAGGGFGAMTRQHGMCVDHLYGVEVVVVNAAGKASVVLATRDPGDPHNDLWWAHTGAGGGNFGVVTRYLFRSPVAVTSTTSPSALLPAPPATTLVTTAVWSWSKLDRTSFSTLVANYGAWVAANSAPGGPYSSLFSGLLLEQASLGTVALICEIDGTLANAKQLMSDMLTAVNQGTGVDYAVQQSTMPWMDAAVAGLYGGTPSANNRSKGKGAYLREPYTADQIGTLYTYLSSDTYSGLGAIVLFSYGGQANAVAPAATANPHRDSVILSYLATYWSDPSQDDEHVAWVRSFYQDLYAGTGGVPAPDTGTDGTYINYPDTDLADPSLNTSGISWSSLYFKGNYARLQSVKRTYDPGDVFRHSLSIRP